MSKLYAGIGSRSTPLEICREMMGYATQLEELGYTLRTGGAIGADTAFESGVRNRSNLRIFRPQYGSEKALIAASEVHPNWSKCNEYSRLYHARNVQIILGESLDSPVEFVLFWTQHIFPSGGTRTGVVVAQENEIPTFNLRSEYQRKDWEKYLSKLCLT